MNYKLSIMTVKLMRANYDCEADKNCVQTYYH